MFRPFTLNIHGELRVFDRPQVMGILNVTPDSFYRGSRANSRREIESRAECMLEEGADIIDIGGCSTRPGATENSLEDEFDRVVSGLEAVRRLSSNVIVSLDTYRSEVVRRCAGLYRVDMVNDVSGGILDKDMYSTVAELRAAYVLMHMRGTPQTMSDLVAYENVTADVIKDMSEKLRDLRLMGVSDVIIDPGFGFAKTLEQNYELMRNLDVFAAAFDEPLLVGISRKSMITKALGITTEDALNGTTALNVIALTRGASFLRVHDVKEAVEAVKLFTLSTGI